MNVPGLSGCKYSSGAIALPGCVLLCSQVNSNGEKKELERNYGVYFIRSSFTAIYISISLFSGRVNRASYCSKSKVYALGSFVPQIDAQTPRIASGIGPDAVKTT